MSAFPPSHEFRIFTLEEANALVPHLSQAFTRIFQLRISAQLLYEKLKDRLDEDRPKNPKDLKDPEFSRDYGKFRAILEAIQEELDRIDSMGVLLKSLENGIVDFYSVSGGKPIFLCWSYGEEKIRYWHEIEAGFSGRRSVEELFQGEKP